MELPKSWDLTTKERSDGKLDIMGKTDAGTPYRVRTTDGPEVTAHDISELHQADREAYSDRKTAAKQYVDSLVNAGKKYKQERDDKFGADMMEAAGPVAFAGLGRQGHTSPFTGSTRAYRQGWERIFGKEN